MYNTIENSSDRKSNNSPEKEVKPGHLMRIP
jgi:hypothetical protein